MDYSSTKPSSGEQIIAFQYLKCNAVGVIGVKVKEGQEIEGPDQAPSHLRNCGLAKIIEALEWKVSDYGDIDLDMLSFDKEHEEKEYKYADLKNCIKIGAANQSLYNNVRQMGENGQFSLVLGGDHGIATGSISGSKSVFPDLKIIWVDAHADANTPETSPSGNYHGMPVAHLLGWIEEKTVPGFDWFKPCLKSDDIVFIGLRDLDKGEKINLKKHNIKCFSMHEVIKYGIGSVVEQTLEYFKADGKEHPIHISFDIDSIDPSIAFGAGCKARGGLQYTEAQYLVREIASTGLLVGFDMVEINPILDAPKEKIHGDKWYITSTCTETILLGLELIASALGDRII